MTSNSTTPCPRKRDYDFAKLDEFCRKDPDCVVTFYGGEPLLNIEGLRQIMDTVSAKHFMIQTNGQLLDRLEPKYVNRFHTILVSIDGEEALTDYYRGKGVFPKSNQQPAANQEKWIQGRTYRASHSHGANRHLQANHLATRQQRVLVFQRALAAERRLLGKRLPTTKF